MSEKGVEQQEKKEEVTEPKEYNHFYRIRFRPEGQIFTAASVKEMPHEEIVMVVTDHGLEPAIIAGAAPICGCPDKNRQASYEIARTANGEELSRYGDLPRFEERGFEKCLVLIEKHKLEMRLVRVERFFNGSKIIFYFTADNRVDFRGLVKDLVQEFRTRVEMRQVGVRHETKMVGGLGTCGRELCCSSFIKKFDSVSIKMAKEQDLPLNPSKISGVCNRLLCCLTYEYDTYRQQRKGMPKPGRKIKLGDEVCKVKRQNPLQQSIVVISEQGEERQMNYQQWKSYKPVRVDKGQKKEKKTKE